MFHISDCKKFNRCKRLFLNDQVREKQPFVRFVRLDEAITDLAARKLHVGDHFLGKRGDDPALAIQALEQYDWLVKARFEYKDLRIKVPFLQRNGSGWRLYFLFAGLYPHADDMQFYCDTVWVLEKNGIELTDIRMIHLNADYVRQGNLNTEELFIVTDKLYNHRNNPTIDFAEAIRKSYTELDGLLERMKAADLASLPEPERKPKCASRQKCRYYHDCFPDEVREADNSILHLISSQHRYAMKKEGIGYLKDADPERIEGFLQQYAQIMADRNGGLFCDRAALLSWMEDIRYPISFLDFEWECFAVPPFDGMRPYDVLLFEYSLHILHEDGSLDHKVFLSVGDDRESLCRNLISDIPADGSLIAYNAIGAEMIRIRELAETFPEFQDELLSLNARMHDLQIPFERGVVYDVRMRGQWSLKTIMSMMDDPGYRNLEIAQGMEAVFQWRYLDREDHTEDLDKIYEDLKAYCSMDTYAMTVVYQWLKNMVKE